MPTLEIRNHDVFEISVITAFIVVPPRLPQLPGTKQ